MDKDGSEFRFIIALNDNYQGGRPYFKNIKLIFSGQNTHKCTWKMVLCIFKLVYRV